MNFLEIAQDKGITVKDHANGWRVMFGDNLLFDTTRIDTIERFLGSCELIQEKDTLALRINGWIHFRISKI